MPQIARPKPREAAFEAWRVAGESINGMLERHGIEIREFVILSYLCEQRDIDVAQIAALVGLSDSTIDFCLARLARERLVRLTPDTPRQQARVMATKKGRLLVQRANTPDA